MQQAIATHDSKVDAEPSGGLLLLWSALLAFDLVLGSVFYLLGETTPLDGAAAEPAAMYTQYLQP